MYVILNEEVRKLAYLDRPQHTRTVFPEDADCNQFQVLRGHPSQNKVSSFTSQFDGCVSTWEY